MLMLSKNILTETLSIMQFFLLNKTTLMILKSKGTWGPHLIVLGHSSAGEPPGYTDNAGETQGARD